MTLNNRIEELAEKFRQNLDLKPWDDFEQEILQKWEEYPTLTQEARDYYKKAKRQCGKTTRGILLNLAEAKITNKKVFLVSGPSTAMTKALYLRVRELAYQLNIDVEIDKVHKNTIVYSESNIEL